MKNKMYSAIEVEIAANMLKKGYEWIARDKYDAIYVYGTKPVKGKIVWTNGGDWLLLMPSLARGVIPLFESIRWTDAEPVNLRGIIRQDTEAAGLRHCNTVPPDTVLDFCNVTKITVETDEEKPVQIAMIEPGKISVAGGYRVRLTPRDTERG